MKVLQICKNSFFLDRFLTPLVRAMIAEGWEVSAAYTPDEVTGRIDIRGLKHFVVKTPLSSEPKKNLLYFKNLYNLIKTYKEMDLPFLMHDKLQKENKVYLPQIFEIKQLE